MFRLNVILASGIALIASVAFAGASDVYDLHGAPEPVLHLRKDAHNAGPSRTSSPLLKYGNGTVLSNVKTYAIFWGADWMSASFAGDKITGMDNFFNGFGGSSYAMTSKEYYDSSGYIASSSSYGGHVIDTSTPPSRNPQVSTIVAEACKATSNNPDPSAIYFIYTSTTAGNVNYCAWHSWGNCSNGAKVQVAYMPNIDGIAGCDPVDTTTKNSQGLAAIANVTGHELLEGITDPRGTGWVDSSGAENGDKCAWSFPSTNNGISTFVNGAQFKIQMEWSNAAYTNGTGELNRSGQKGCIY